MTFQGVFFVLSGLGDPKRSLSSSLSGIQASMGGLSVMAEVEKKGGICTVREVWSSHLFFLGTGRSLLPSTMD